LQVQDAAKRWIAKLITPFVLVAGFIVKTIYGGLFAWWLDPRLQRKANRTADLLEERVRRDLTFLFDEYGATVTSNIVERFGAAEVTVAAGSLELCFGKNDRDAADRLLVAPRDGHGVWELLNVALAAATGDDPKSLVVPFSYSDEPTTLSYVGLTRVAEILKPRFARLQRAFAPENYPTTHSRMAEIERMVHPR
jgi:hypothetical protein